MTKLKCITLFLYAAVFSATAMADDNVRDGRPCLSGICVGDEISTLTGIKWQPATNIMGMPIKSNDQVDVKSLLKKFAPSSAADVTAAAPYLMYHSFDGQAIQKLAKVKGFCEKDILGVIGNFISDSGHKTQVFVNVVPGADPATQSLRVTQIERTFPAEYTREQINELSKQLEERYRGVKRTSSPMFAFQSGPKPSWAFVVSFERKLTLSAPMGDSKHIRDQLLKYPGCGKSLKID